MTSPSRKFDRVSLILQFALFIVTVIAFVSILFDGEAEIAMILFAMLGMIQLCAGIFFLLKRNFDRVSRKRLNKYLLFVAGYFVITGLSIYIESNYSIIEDTFSNPFIPVEAIVSIVLVGFPLCLATYLLWIFKNARIIINKKVNVQDVLDSNL